MSVLHLGGSSPIGCAFPFFVMFDLIRSFSCPNVAQPIGEVPRSVTLKATLTHLGHPHHPFHFLCSVSVVVCDPADG